MLVVIKAIINNAEKMNSEAANALLKTLEEPAEKTIILLLTKDEKQLPETIISRSQIINFFPVKNEDIKFELAKKYEKEKVAEVVELCNGLPGLAIKWLEDKEIFSEYKKEINRFKSLFGEPFYKKLSIVKIYLVIRQIILPLDNIFESIRYLAIRID